MAPRRVFAIDGLFADHNRQLVCMRADEETSEMDLALIWVLSPQGKMLLDRHDKDSDGVEKVRGRALLVRQRRRRAE